MNKGRNLLSLNRYNWLVSKAMLLLKCSAYSMEFALMCQTDLFLSGLTREPQASDEICRNHARGKQILIHSSSLITLTPSSVAFLSLLPVNSPANHESGSSCVTPPRHAEAAVPSGSSDFIESAS